MNITMEARKKSATYAGNTECLSARCIGSGPKAGKIKRKINNFCYIKTVPFMAHILIRDHNRKPAFNKQVFTPRAET